MRTVAARRCCAYLVCARWNLCSSCEVARIRYIVLITLLLLAGILVVSDIMTIAIPAYVIGLGLFS